MADQDTNQEQFPIDDDERQEMGSIASMRPRIAGPDSNAPFGGAISRAFEGATGWTQPKPAPPTIAPPYATTQPHPALTMPAPGAPAAPANAIAPASQSRPAPPTVAGPGSAPAVRANAVAAPTPRLTIAPPSPTPSAATPVQAQVSRPAPMALPALSNQPTAPTMAPPTAAPVAGTPVGANILHPAGPMMAPPTAQSGVGRLWSASGRIGGDNPTLKDKILRDVARFGTGVLTAGDVAAESLDPRLASLIPGSEINTNLRNNQAWQQSVQTAQLDLDRQKEAARDGARQAAKEADNAREAHEQAETDLAEEQLNKLKEKPDDKFLYHDVDDNGNAIAVFQGQNGPYSKPLGYEAGAKPTNKPTFASPFEAFAYGSPEEKKSAQDFLGLEKRLGTQYDKPGEIEQRYDLYKKDPDAYRAMFGDRGGSQDATKTSRDQAQAARMLKYFDSQRKTIDNDFTLDDQTKQQKLAEIDELEKPYQDAAQVTSSGGRTNSGTRNTRDNFGALRSQLKPGEVLVIGPDGSPGAIPKANLQKAQKRGYKLAPGQAQ